MVRWDEIWICYLSVLAHGALGLQCLVIQWCLRYDGPVVASIGARSCRAISARGFAIIYVILKVNDAYIDNLMNEFISRVRQK